MFKPTLIEAAKAGAAEILRFFNNDFIISHKEGVNNLVTEADHASEKAILNTIKSQFPDHYILSEETEVIKACLVTGFPYTYINIANGPLEIFERLIRKGVPVRRLGSAAIDLCWVACGRFDGFYEHKLEAWDSAAGYLIVEEAGGKVTDFTGNKFSHYQPHVLATNGKIHKEMLAVINNKKEL